MATHSSVLAWRIPGTGETGGSAALAARSVLPSNRPATPLFLPACWVFMAVQAVLSLWREGAALRSCVWVKSLSGVRLLATPWTAAYQAPLSLGFSRSGVPLPSPISMHKPA